MAIRRRAANATNSSSGFSSKFCWARPALAAALALGLFVQGAEPASAGRRRAGAEKEKAAERAPKGPLFAVVSLASQRVSFYDSEGLWTQGRVSTGTGSHPTPTGLFVILEKERWHRSNIYHGASMPFMQRLAWTGVAMHEGYVTGRPASHGCIRLQHAFARRLFDLTSIGQRVVVSPYDITPAGVSHASLPAPRLLPAPDPQPEQNPQPGPAASAPKANVVASKAPETASDAATGAAGTLLDPLQYAKALNGAASARSEGAARAAKAASLRLAELSRQAQVLAATVKSVEKALDVTRRDLEAAVRKTERAQGEAAQKRAADLKEAMEKRLAELLKRSEEARKAKAAAGEELEGASVVVQDARQQAGSAAAAQQEAFRRLEPLSMLVSRKTGRLHVRQGFKTVFEAPVTIRDPERPLGTHLFVAMQASGGGAALNWTALTIPAVTAWGDERRPRRRFRDRSEEPQAPASLTGDSAAGALDRIEIPQEARERISGLLWTGATLIVSDLGPSGEGRFAMDFQILTHARGRGR